MPSPTDAIPILTPRLQIRPYEASDLDVLHETVRNPKVFFWRKTPMTRDETQALMDRSRALFEQSRMGWWLVSDRRTAQPMGQVILQPLANSGEIEIGYHFRPEYWGSGYATEAASALRDYAFDVLELPRLVAVVLPTNTPSQNVMRRLGLPKVGRRIHADLEHDYFSLERAEFLARRAAVAAKK